MIKSCRTISEIQAASRELLMIRRQEMSVLLERDRDAIVEELTKRGLAIHVDRI
jgi:hypothetical protein